MNVEPRRRWLKTVVFLIITVGVVLLVSLRIQQRLQEPAVPAQRPLLVETVTVTRQPFARLHRSVGTVTADRRIRLSAQLSASVQEVLAREGARVEQGELLLMLDDSEARREVERLEASRQRAQAELSFWQEQLHVHEQLAESGALDRRSLEDTRRRAVTLEASMRETEALLEQARYRLRYASIHAPFEAYVQSNLILNGEQVMPGTPLIELVASEPMKVVTQVAERDLGELAEGQPATIEIPVLQRSFETVVRRIYPALEPRSRNATVELSLPKDSDGVRPGMAAAVEIITQQSPASLVVPRHSVHQRKNEEGVFLLIDDVAQWRRVTTGPAQDEVIVLLDGVNADDTLIVTPHPRLADGRSVTAALPAGRNP